MDGVTFATIAPINSSRLAGGGFHIRQHDFHKISLYVYSVVRNDSCKKVYSLEPSLPYVIAYNANKLHPFVYLFVCFFGNMNYFRVRSCQIFLEKPQMCF